MRLSVDIPDPLLQRAKRLARERGVTLRQLVLESLQSLVDRSTEMRRYRMKDLSFGKGGLVHGLSWGGDHTDDIALGGHISHSSRCETP